MQPSRILVLVSGLLLGGLPACTRVPAIESQLTPELRAADYPELIPLDGLTSAGPAPTEMRSKTETELQARAARLRARAAALKAAQL